MNEVIYNLPEGLNDYTGQFILFFSDAEEPEVLFSTFIAEEAYKKAEEISQALGKVPSVILVQKEESVSLIAARA